MVQIAIEVGSMGPQVRAAMVDLYKGGRAEVLLDLVERAPSEEAGAPVWEFLKRERVLEALLQLPRVDMPLVARFARRTGIEIAPTLLSAAAVFDDAKIRAQFYDLLQSLGDDVGAVVAERIPTSTPIIQRELLALLGRLGTLPSGFSAINYLANEEPLVRREAVRLLFRDPAERDETIMSALTDTDDRVVFAGLTIAQEKCPPAGIDLIMQRVDRGELDSQLRTMGIRIVAQLRTPATLAWILRYVVTEAHWPRKPKLRASTPEMLAALAMVATYWLNDPAAETAVRLAGQSRDPEVRAKVARGRGTATPAKASKNE
jgi:HEAT repeat protein